MPYLINKSLLVDSLIPVGNAEVAAKSSIGMRCRSGLHVTAAVVVLGVVVGLGVVVVLGVVIAVVVVVVVTKVSDLSSSDAPGSSRARVIMATIKPMIPQIDPIFPSALIFTQHLQQLFFEPDGGTDWFGGFGIGLRNCSMFAYIGSTCVDIDILGTGGTSGTLLGTLLSLF